jgi:hypothetical protein
MYNSYREELAANEELQQIKREWRQEIEDEQSQEDECWGKQNYIN